MDAAAALSTLRRKSSCAIMTAGRKKGSRLNEDEMSCGLCGYAFELPRRPIKEDDPDFSHCPKLLDCLHRFCQSCILEAIDKSHAPAFFGCPTCQKRQEISDVNNGAMRLTNDYTILKEIKRRQLDLYEASCDECNDEVAAGYRCRDCGGTALCNFHMEAHERSRALKSHTIDSLDEYAAKKDIKKRVMSVPISKCWKLHHQESPYVYYCQECEVLLCERCRIEDHGTCAYTLVAQVANASRQKLESSLEQLNSSFECIKITINDLAVSMNQVTTNTDDLRKTIHRCFMELQKGLEKREREVIQALERVQEQKLESLSRKRAILDQGLQNLEASYQLADRSVYGLTDCDFMSMYKPLYRRLQATSLQLKDLDQFDSRRESQSVSFGYSLRDRELLNEGINKFGGILQDGGADTKKDPSRSSPAAKQQSLNNNGPLVALSSSPKLEFIILSQASKCHGKETRGTEPPKLEDDGEESVVIEIRQIPQRHIEIECKANEEKQANDPVGLTSMDLLAKGVRKQGPLLGKLMLATKMEGPAPSSSVAASTTLSLSAQQKRRYSVSQFFESLEDECNRPTLRITKLIKVP